MTPSQKKELREFVPETLLYGLLVALFCFGVFRLLGRPLQLLFQQHRVEYAFLALMLMGAQGFLLERLARWLCSLFRRSGKANP